MTQRRFNFLKRQKIFGKDIDIKLSVSDSVKRFSIVARLNEYNFPSNANIYLDVSQSSMETIRFHFGSIGTPSFKVEDISRLTGQNVVFNLYVVDVNTAQILGVAEAVKAQNGETSGSNSLLPVDGTKNLSGNFWRVDFDISGAEGATDGPILRIDRDASLNSVANFLRNPLYAGLILPSAMRLILNRILLEEKDFEYDPSSASWRNAWVRFAIKQNGQNLPEETNNDDYHNWINEACASFSRRSNLYDEFLKNIKL